MPTTSPEQVFQTSKTFADFNLHPDLLQGIQREGFEHPTDIQARLIPLALEGRDLLGQARTGTGKTAAFGLPLLHQIDPSDSIAGLILVPTRELAIQVTHELHNFGHHMHHRIVAIYGGQPIRAQVKKLERGASIVVATPGRALDLEHRGILSLDKVRHVVLDEVDRMLDIGFRDDIRRILGRIKSPHQTIFVSATISTDIEALARRHMNNPEKIVTTAGSLTVEQVSQSFVTVQRWDKKPLLLHLLRRDKPHLAVIFCATKRAVDGVADFLSRNGIDAHAIHGDMYQSKRNKVMEKLRSGGMSVLVASDLAARGLDVEDVSHVINYDVPVDSEVYVHRIGRTARIGREGVAYTFVTPDEGKLLTAVEMLINREIVEEPVPDFKPGPVPDRVKQEREAAETENASARSVAKRTAAPTVETKDREDATKFPGGIVPSASPKRRLGGKVRGRRR